MSLRVFCSVAELKSFSVAAERLGLSPAMASKHVMYLESRVGSRLLNRTSRHVSMTEAGMLYFTQAKQLIEGLDETEGAIRNVAVMPSGTLKLSAPVWFANSSIARTFSEYRQRYPNVGFDIDFSGRMVNLVDESFDLVLRATSPDRLDAGLVARPLADIMFHLVGSPAYLARSGLPAKISELNGHSLLHYSGVHYNGGLAMEGPEGPETVKFQIVMQSENETMLHLAALEGMGLAFLPAFMTQPDIAANRLAVVLPDILKFSRRLHAVYPSRKYLSAKVRTFIDFLASKTDLRPERGDD